MPARPLIRWLAAPLLTVLVGVAAFFAGTGAGAPWSPAAAGGQVTQGWVARHNGPGIWADVANALAVDGAGNVYVTGYSWDAGTAGDYTTIKYGPDGSEQWVARYDGPGNGADEAYGLAVDGVGNVYVTGYSHGSGTGEDYATIKYGPDGSEQWVRRYNGPGNGGDVARALAVDEAGNVYVTGYSYGSDASYQYATIRYGPDGSERWVARYNGPDNSHDVANALAVDGAGDVYVTGWSWGYRTGDDYATVKYGPDGSEQWVRRYNGPGDYGEDVARALAVDGADNVYVMGYSYGSGTDYDYATIKYGPDGSEQWVRRYNGPGSSDDEANALAVDGSGDVYVTGRSYGGAGTDYDYATIKYVQGSPVGGIAELPALAETSAEDAAAPGRGSGSSAGSYAAVAAVGLAAAAFVGVFGWYARRRWLRQR